MKLADLDAAVGGEEGVFAILPVLGSLLQPARARHNEMDTNILDFM